MFALKRSAVGIVAAFVIMVAAPGAAQADELPAPAVTTLAATDVTATTATLHATVSPNSTATTGYFVYGTAPDQLTLRTPDVTFAAAPGEMALDATVSQLTARTRYYVLAVAENDDWIVTGDTLSFTTLRPPQPKILGGTASDITYQSATLHLNVVTQGRPVTVSGTVSGRPGSATITFGPIPVTVDGDVAIPLPALVAGAAYKWRATATSVDGDGTASGVFTTERLITMPSPRLTPAVATYGSLVTISGTIANKPGLVVTLAEQAYPFVGPIGPLAGTVATTDAAGAYAFAIRAERPVAYGVTAEGAAALTVRDVAKLRVAPAVTAKAKRARHHRSVVAGRYQPAITSKVSLYRRGAGRVGVARTSNGTFRFPARVLKPGKYEVRVTPVEGTGFERATSAVLTVPRR